MRQFTAKRIGDSASARLTLPRQGPLGGGLLSKPAIALVAYAFSILSGVQVAHADLKYHGGPVLSTVEVVEYFYGPWSNKDIDDHHKYVENLTKYISGEDAPANMTPTLAQYGVISAHVAWPVTDPTKSTPTNLTAAGTLKIIHDAQASGTLPPYAENRLIVLLLPSGTTLKDQHCAYHGAEGLNKYYAQVTRGCSPWLRVTAHEIFEAATDPAINIEGGYDEAVDPCSNSFSTSFGFVPAPFDNLTHSCTTTGYDAIPPPKLTGMVWSDKRAFFFYGKQYVRYTMEPSNEGVDPGYPVPIDAVRDGHEVWLGLSAKFPAGIDAAVAWPNGDAYFFQGSRYVRYTMDPAHEGVQAGYPRPVLPDSGGSGGGWKGVWPGGVDAAVVWNADKAYFFKGKEYIRYDVKSDHADPGYPKAIDGSEDGKAYWPGLAQAFPEGVDSAVVWPNGKAYFFKGDKYVRYNMDPKNEGVEAGFPKPIKGNWPGLEKVM